MGNMGDDNPHIMGAQIFNPIKIIIADDHAVFRNGLAVFLDKEPGLDVIGEAGDGLAALNLISQAEVDVLILDISMPGPDLKTMISKALALKPGLNIVVLTMHDDEFYLREAFRAGARAFILKKSSASDLVKAIRSAQNKSMFIDPALSHLFVESYRSPGVKRRTPAVILSAREEEILVKLAYGYTSEEIAELVDCSHRTIDAHRAHIMKKLGFKTRAELVRYAIDRGYLKKYSTG